MLIRKSFCSVALILLTAGSFGVASFAAPAGRQGNGNQSTTKSRKRVHNTSPRHQAASTKGNKHGQRTIIFVGGRKGSPGTATKSNPTGVIKSNGALNPQPIPPGKQRKPE
jgi:hypothetical protein